MDKSQKELSHSVTNAPKDENISRTEPKVKVTVIKKQCVTLRDPKMYSHTKFGIATSNNIGDMVRTRFV